MTDATKPVAYLHRLVGTENWNLSDEANIGSARIYQRYYPDEIEIKPLYGPEVLARAERAEALLAEAKSGLIQIAHTFTEDSHGNTKTLAASEYQGMARATLTKIQEARHADNG